MASFTLKNIPVELYEMLKHQARANHRSMNSEIIFTLKKALGTAERGEFDQILRQQASEFRRRVNIVLSEEEINEAKRSGRE